MRLSRFHLATVKEVPADAEIASHRLMLRAGMVRKLAAGIYTWSPLGLARAAQGRSGRARGDEPRRRDRAPDAVDAAEGAVGRDRPLGEVRRPAAQDQGSQGRLVLLRPDARGSHHRFRAQRAQELQAAAGQLLSDPDQVPRRDPPALRRHARARIPDEGCVLVPPRRAIARRRIPQHVRHLRAHLHAARPRVPRGAGRHRRDRRQREPRIPGAGRFGRGRDRVLDRFGLRREHRNGRSARADGMRGRAPAARARTRRDADAEDHRGSLRVARRSNPAQCIKTIIVRGSDGLVALCVRGDHEINEVKAAKLAELPGESVLADEAAILAATGVRPGFARPGRPARIDSGHRRSQRRRAGRFRLRRQPGRHAFPRRELGSRRARHARRRHPQDRRRRSRRRTATAR